MPGTLFSPSLRRILVDEEKEEENEEEEKEEERKDDNENERCSYVLLLVHVIDEECVREYSIDKRKQTENKIISTLLSI